MSTNPFCFLHSGKLAGLWYEISRFADRYAKICRIRLSVIYPVIARFITLVLFLLI